MKATIAICIALMLVGPAKAQDAQKLTEIVDNFSYENLVCGAYYLFVSQCLKNKNEKDPTADQYFTAGNTFLERGIIAGRAAKVSDKAISARVDLAVEQMKEDTENSCVNIAVLLKKHAKSCKQLFEKGPERLLDQVSGKPVSPSTGKARR